MNARGIRATELADATGLSRARISQYTNAKYVPGADGICRLARALGVSEAWLLGDDAPAADALLPTPENVSALTLRRYPVLGRIACGAPILAQEHIEGYVPVPENIHADFALICKGDSMVGARIFDGDTVYIRRQDTVENGEIAAVLIDGEATLKRIRRYADSLCLQPENPKYRPLILWAEEMNQIRILGKAVAFTSTVI